MIDVVAAIIMDGSKVLIARRAADQSLPGKWEFPGGKIEEDEKPEEALRRELQEEFGVESTVGQHLITVKHRYPKISIRLMAYYVTVHADPVQSSDHDRIDWVSKDNLPSRDIAAADVPIFEALRNEGING